MLRRKLKDATVAAYEHGHNSDLTYYNRNYNYNHNRNVQSYTLAHFSFAPGPALPGISAHHHLFLVAALFAVTVLIGVGIFVVCACVGAVVIVGVGVLAVSSLY
ncbi:hypothetical protein DENSPDRAFT_527478 [Dentipellis sp. KUC8613]|nr:hypothetical protein DENSPDRAFT_527478 [Dentipellis sp. KUC8613]